MSNPEQSSPEVKHPLLDFSLRLIGGVALVAVGVAIVREAAELFDGLSVSTGLEHTVTK